MLGAQLIEGKEVKIDPPVSPATRFKKVVCIIRFPSGSLLSFFFISYFICLHRAFVREYFQCLA